MVFWFSCLLTACLNSSLNFIFDNHAISITLDAFVKNAALLLGDCSNIQRSMLSYRLTPKSPADEGGRVHFNVSDFSRFVQGTEDRNWPTYLLRGSSVYFVF